VYPVKKQEWYENQKGYEKQKETGETKPISPTPIRSDHERSAEGGSSPVVILAASAPGHCDPRDEICQQADAFQEYGKEPYYPDDGGVYTEVFTEPSAHASDFFICIRQEKSPIHLVHSFL
jgi:hypothetical protein